MSRLHPSRLGRLLLALVLFSIGIANAFIPGPGGSVFILGSALVLAGESHAFAALLDRGEQRLQPQLRWIRRRPLLAVGTITCLVTAIVAAIGVATASG